MGLSSLHRFIPKSVLCFKRYNRSTFLADLIAGVTVGLVALPLAMAFAISSGLSPESGIYTAIVAGFIISAFGGSKTQIGGPTGAFVVVVSGIVATYGIDGLFMCTLIAGVILVLLGVTGLGTAVKYFPRPVVIGFTNGIAVLIASTQIKDLLGLQIAIQPGEFLERMGEIFHRLDTFSANATVVSMFTILVILLLNRRGIPGTVVAMILGTLVVSLFTLPVETIASRFGDIPRGLPKVSIPSFHLELLLPLLSPALTVAMLGAIESLLSAVVADRMSGDKHNPNVELVAQGLANIASPLFGGLPATGAIARTATNIRSGAKTPVAGMIHALTVLLIILIFAPFAKLIPLSVLSAILMIVAYNMGEWREIPGILKLGKGDIAIWLITFLLTVFADLTVAVEAGMVLAALTYIRRVTNTTTVAEVTPQYVEDGFRHSLQINPIPEGVSVFRIHGPFLFGASDKLSQIEDRVHSLGKVVVVRLRNMTAIDGTGLHALEKLADELRASGRELILCGARQQPARFMEDAEFHRIIGDDNLKSSLAEALDRAKGILAEER